MKGKKILYAVWIVVLALILIVSLNYRGESAIFYGIAETAEIAVNSDSAVEIKEIRVVPGQDINKGDLIVELEQPELNIKINEISHLLDELKVKKLAGDSAIKSQINQLKAELASTTSDINYQIRQLKTQYDINRELTSELKSIENQGEKSNPSGFDNPTDLKIEGLKKELEMAENLIQIKTKLLTDELNSPENAYTIQIESLEKELNLMLEKKRNLLIYSQINGVIGSVNYKEGEKVSPFTPIVTLHTKSPSYIIGYIHENVYNKVIIGDKLKVVSLASRGNNALGEVVGVGSRIVQFPERLRRRPEFQLWGREVQIKIPQDNNFLLGEKVLISPLKDGKQSYWSRLKERLLWGKTHAEVVR